MLHILTSIDTYLYYPVLLIILALAAIFLRSAPGLCRYAALARA